MAGRTVIRMYQDFCRKLSNSQTGPLAVKNHSRDGMSSMNRLLWKQSYSKSCQSWKLRIQNAQNCTYEYFDMLSVLMYKKLPTAIAQRFSRNIGIARLHKLMEQGSKSGKRFFTIGPNTANFGSRRHMGVVFAAACFNWDKENIDDQEIGDIEKQFDYISRVSKNEVALDDPQHPGEWEKIIDRECITMWRRPINNNLYEYKVYGTFTDIPARAFFNAQVDFNFRKSWDTLIIKLEAIERDSFTGTEVVQWITKFPYPLYDREYIYLRKTKVDVKRNLMWILSRSIDHPSFPPEKSKNVRVDTFMSNLVLKPHNSFDDNGFDYILTYHDDPKSNFPSVAYNWMASTGVPNFADKLHDSAVRYMDLKDGVAADEDEKESIM